MHYEVRLARIIRTARIEKLGKYQSCMVSKLRTGTDGREVEVTIPEGVLGGDEFEVFVGELDEDAVAEE